MAEIEWPWQYNFPPFFTIQPHAETREKQMAAWRKLILEYFNANHWTTLDVQEVQKSKLFCNEGIQRQLSVEGIQGVLGEMERRGEAAPRDKGGMRWDIYWRSAGEWGDLLLGWVSNNGMNNTVCTIHELVEGDNTTGEEFHGLDATFLVKILRSLEAQNKCELIVEDEECQGVKFF